MATKQNNFYLQYQQAAKAGKTSARNAFLRKAAPGVIIVSGCWLVFGAIILHGGMMVAQTNALRRWCSSDDVLTTYQQSLQDQQAADTYRSLAGYANELSSLLDSYPDLTSSLLNHIDAAGSSSGITVEFTSYDASTGVLQFNATSDTVIDIPAYVRALQGCGVFSSVEYSGYQSTNNSQDSGYALNLHCILAAPE